MRIGAVQFYPVFGGVARNIAKAVSLIRGQQVRLWVLPELFASGYQFRDRVELSALAEGLDGPTVTTMAAKAAELGCWICGGFPERAAEGVYNSAFLLGPEGQVEIYRKVHLFDREKELFLPGNEQFRAVEAAGIKVGMMICFDWFFPESARSLALAGAQIILHPANLVLPHCPAAMATRALENRLFTVTANRIGREERVAGESLRFIGSSVIYGPSGNCLAAAGEDDEGVLVVEIDPAAALAKQLTGRNGLWGDRRPEQYRLQGP